MTDSQSKSGALVLFLRFQLLSAGYLIRLCTLGFEGGEFP